MLKAPSSLILSERLKAIYVFKLINSSHFILIKIIAISGRNRPQHQWSTVEPLWTENVCLVSSWPWNAHDRNNKHLFCPCVGVDPCFKPIKKTIPFMIKYYRLAGVKPFGKVTYRSLDHIEAHILKISVQLHLSMDSICLNKDTLHKILQWNLILL